MKHCAMPPEMVDYAIQAAQDSITNFNTEQVSTKPFPRRAERERERVCVCARACDTEGQRREARNVQALDLRLTLCW